ncbi:MULTISPECIES: DNA cytosine methyltransferase [Alistipes]|jgi:DNA (cytosine-5)-methyltransferase 1|uniref:DNA cytosine methyltransferase n=1 Tax=Alistipes TaxID=239759 RepID=UPI0011C95BA6|nr:DNA cytosine methyltransferase [Alistipes timonensis]MCR2030744.1 DNA cytosine methyltransferase [Alistipes timonensis]
MKLLYIDLFCGAGGTSTGVENARYEGRQCAKVIGCVNHDANAIASHAANHPDALHFTEDIRTLELSPLTAHIAEMRRQYPDAFVVLWASLECTNFSKAKGGQPRDADSRTLAEHLFRYIEAINPDYIQIENVEEFMSWGDLDESGKPISKDAGRLYQQWVSNVCGYGYRFAHRILNSADYGAYTTRRRFFGIFAKESLPIVFPEPTHSKDGATGLFGRTQRWKPVREVLDFSDEGESIFGRKKPLVDATLERIYAGLIKFVAGGKEAFLVKWNSMSQTGKYHAPSIDEPCPTVATQNRLGIAQVNFLSKHYGGSPEGKCVSVEEPAGTITTWDHHSFITAYYGNGHNHSIDAPAPTLTTRDRLAFVDMQYGNGTPCDIESPAPTVTTNPKHQLVTCRMEQQESTTTITSDDSPAMAKIKRFMALYGIVDIKMRMLRIPELKRIMGFPPDYVLVGTQADQKKFIGNAVEVNMARVLCEALCARLIEGDWRPIQIAA